jgi:hypothetical protein
MDISSSYTPSESTAASRSTHEKRTKLEIATSNLALEFPSSVLSLTLPEHKYPRLEFLNIPTKFITSLGKFDYMSINDGSLVQRDGEMRESRALYLRMCTAVLKARLLSLHGKRVTQ